MLPFSRSSSFIVSPPLLRAVPSSKVPAIGNPVPKDSSNALVSRIINARSPGPRDLMDPLLKLKDMPLVKWMPVRSNDWSALTFITSINSDSPFPSG